MAEEGANELRADVVIVGAGVVGSALAMALGELGHSDVLVVDADLEGTLSSSELNAGGVRATFHQDLNVECSRISIDWFAEHAAEVGYRPVGYLWMHRPDAMDRIAHGRGSESDLDRWNRLGWPVEAWDVAKLREYAPFIDKTDDLAGAIFGKRDGLLNPNLLKGFYRERARAKGVRFADRLALRASVSQAGGVDLDFESLPAEMDRDAKEKLYGSIERAASEGGPRVRVSAGRVVNCAGAWAKEVARALGYGCPSWSVRRQISLFDCREVDLSAYGMMIDPSGVYFHPEAGFILGGIAEREEPRGQNFGYGGEEFFQEKIWLPLSERSGKFEALRHLSGWGGLYEVSPDESAIIGEVRGPGVAKGRVFESHSYSGHGVMHSYACGLALAERLARGKSSTVDLEPFNGDRFEKGRLIPETAVI